MKLIMTMLGLLSVMGIQACSHHYPAKVVKKTPSPYYPKSAYLKRHLETNQHQTMPHCHRHKAEKLHCHGY